ncbi:hypothetical protein ACD591_08265 [Rufibacter glacialis]|uniref:Uncharacterized protein n=1 Tax=Rufibacter glacialis TaxID=1259555 RepID=A0A5M8Q9B3_9BACT|nr:hypothetical protein [Rufibacter glacialis]KAA6432557.1 hypothetical protein FOE74_15845 [Rufibacter glacialis]GGK79796.1 hypothetical protein GCM10011405_29490 [Rufibacter glacialis]
MARQIPDSQEEVVDSATAAQFGNASDPAEAASSTESAAAKRYTFGTGKNPRTKADLARELSFCVLGFGVIMMGLLVHVIKCSHIEKENIVRVLMVTLIIISTLFLITAGYSNDQIAPAIGLLGTVAGYLLGKSSSPTSNDQPKG